MSELHDKAMAYSSQPKLRTTLESPLATKEDLSLAYTPGIAEVCKAIQEDEKVLNTHTFRRNNLAVISDGSAVLGLGNIGHKAGYPVMEGKAMLFKRFADIDAVPIIIKTQDPREFIETVVNIADSFNGINLEDISAPRCFEIEEELKSRLDMPIMHDDQHGTAVVSLAALLNALELTGRTDPSAVRIVFSGAGSAGIAVARLFATYGFRNIIMVDSKGAIHKKRTDLTVEKQWIADISNPDQKEGSLPEVLQGADVFFGVSKANLLTRKEIATMNPNAIVIAMANPVPEILPDEAKAGGAAIVATGRSDFPNQVNNALAFPGIFKGAFVHRSAITTDMLFAAVDAIREYHKAQLAMDFLLPSILDPKVHEYVAQKVAEASQH